MKIQDFNQFRDVNLIQPQRATLQIPTFVLAADTWSGASDLLLEFPIGNANWFSLKLPLSVFGSNFVPAVRYSLDGVTYRFKFYEDVGEVLYFPVYNGEKLGPGAVIEIWSVDSISLPALLTAEILQTSNLIFPITGCNPCCQNNSSEVILVGVEPTLAAPCNPFCTSEGCDGVPPDPGPPPVGGLFVMCRMYNPSNDCAGTVTGGTVYNIYSLDGQPMIWQKSTGPQTGSVPLASTLEVFLIEFDAAFLAITNGGPQTLQTAVRINQERRELIDGLCTVVENNDRTMTYEVMLINLLAQAGDHTGLIDDPYIIDFSES